MRIRGAGGLGDSAYLVPVARYYASRGDSVLVSSSYGDLYRGIQGVSAIPFQRGAPVDIECTYVRRRQETHTTQYEDTLILAGVPLDTPFIASPDSIDREYSIDSRGRPICVVHAPYTRRDKHGVVCNTGISIASDILERFIDRHRDKYFFVGTGGGAREIQAPLQGLDLDLTGRTTLRQYLSVMRQSALSVSQCGHPLPIAEMLGRKAFVVYGAGMRTTDNFLSRTATPDKTRATGTSAWAWSDDADLARKMDTYAEESIMAHDTPQVPRLYVDRMIRGKRVVVIGSAPSALRNRGEDIDGYDTIIRVNNYDLGRDSNSLGTRTDIYYSFFGSSIKHTAEQLRKEKVQVLVSKIPYADYTRHYAYGRDERHGVLNFKKYYDNWRWRGLPIYIPRTTDLIDECALIGRMMSSGVSAIKFALSCEPKSLYVTGFDFFASGIHDHHARWRNGAGGHATHKEREYVKSLYKKSGGVLVPDETLKKILEA